MGLIFCIGTSSLAISSFATRTIHPCCWDFGAARQAIGARSRSVTSIITPGYAPIEQYSSRGDQGAWTDIYALGAVCYRALTGQVPDDATDRTRRDPLIPVSERCAGQASVKFLSAIDSALQVNEEDRPQSIAGWRVVLGEETGSSVTTPPSGPSPTPPPKIQDQARDDVPVHQRVDDQSPPSPKIQRQVICCNSLHSRFVDRRWVLLSI